VTTPTTALPTLSLADTDPADLTVDAVVIGVHSQDGAEGSAGELLLASGAESIAAAFDGKLTATLAVLGATGGAGEVTKVATLGTIAAPVLVAVGLGAEPAGAAPGPDTLRRATAAAVRALAGAKKVALGDRAVRDVLDAIEAALEEVGGWSTAGAASQIPNRIEHCQILHPTDIPRFAQLGVIASMQPLHAAVSAPGQVWAQRVGVERWGRSFPWQTLRESGAHLVFGSDWPVVTQNPFLSMYAAMARQPWAPGQPRQAQTLEATLAAYTRDAAYAEFQEDRKGQLRAGMLADLALLSGNLEATPLEQLAGLTAALTICSGRIVYEDL